MRVQKPSFSTPPQPLGKYAENNFWDNVNRFAYYKRVCIFILVNGSSSNRVK